MVCCLRKDNYMLIVFTAQSWPLILNSAHLAALVQSLLALCLHGKAAGRNNHVPRANPEVRFQRRWESHYFSCEGMESCKWLPDILMEQFFKNLIYFHSGIKKYSSYKPKITIYFVVTSFVPYRWSPCRSQTPNEELKILNEVQFLFPFIGQFQNNSPKNECLPKLQVAVKRNNMKLFLYF